MNFELATQPGITVEEKRRLLHVVIVGGGPTGVEFGAEFYDFLKQVHDLVNTYFHHTNKCNGRQVHSLSLIHI